MKRASIAAAVLIAFTLTGCAGAPQGAGDERTTPEVSESTKPLTAETPDAPTGTDAEAAFVDLVRKNLRPDNVIPNATDEQLLEAGHNACDAVAAGTPTDQISVIEGEELNAVNYYTDSAVIVSATAKTLCPR